MNKITIEIYVTEEDVQNNFSLCRPDCIDEDLAQEKSDDTNMDDSDIEIATIRKGNIRYFLITSCNHWNLYLGKEKWNHSREPLPLDDWINSWETIDMTNITGDSDEWNSITDMIQYLMSLKF